jgi:uncharacterized damage-inducible protein DinB
MERARIADQLRRSVNGEAWHGPSVMELLADVSWRQAAAKPIPAAHSIWEIVLHIAVWADVGRRRASGERVEPTPAEDWPAVGEISDAAWRGAIEHLVHNEASLAALIDTSSDDQLSATNYVLLHGVVQHNAYHAGQIALLKKF